ncbi:alpha/beta hydrolase [Corynebacterium sp. 335C]
MNNDSTSEVTPADHPAWTGDVLPGFIAATRDLGRDPDGETDVAVTVVRYDPSHPAAAPAPDGSGPAAAAGAGASPAGVPGEGAGPGAREGSADAGAAEARDDASRSGRPAVLWVHGLSDYFFQDHLARDIDAAGWAFYALDLRKCGRSHRPGQRRHFVTDLAHYDADLDAALDLVAAEGHDRVVVAGHSTGGLVIAGWLDRKRANDPARHGLLAGALFDSPWFELPVADWKLPVARPLTRLVGRLMPERTVPADELAGYGESLHRSRRGEWDYDLEHKPLKGFPMPFAWLAAIVRAQDALAKGLETGVPNLVLRSDRSWLGKPYSAATDSADAVLNVEHIERRARCLGGRTRTVTVPGARHDVYLSKEHARALAMRETLDFLRGLAD